MENLILLLASSLLVRLTPKKARNRFIGTTGCSALVFSSGAHFHKSITDSGDDLYFHEHSEGEVRYGVICVHLQQQQTIAYAQELLQEYIEMLKDPFYILHQTGLKNDADWNSESTHTVVDYWQDRQHQDWKIKGYTNGRQIAVLYVKNINHVDVARQDLFLDSFHFPAA